MRRSHLIACLAGLVVGLVLVPAVVTGQEAPGARAPGDVLTLEPVSPCRIVDTRLSSRMAEDETRGFLVTGTAGFPAQGGMSGGCGIPAAAEAVVFSITAVNPDGQGYLRMWPAAESPPTATILNFDTTLNATNSVAIGVSSGAEHISARAFESATDLVIDVSGYYQDNPDVTALESRVDALETILESVTRTNIGGRDTLTFSGMNVRINNGGGGTEVKNGLGNLFIGYNNAAGDAPTQTGSHYVAIGDDHSFTESAGLLVGLSNTVEGLHSVATGWGSQATGSLSFVAGGLGSVASGDGSFASGTISRAEAVNSFVGGGSGHVAAVAGCAWIGPMNHGC